MSDMLKMYLPLDGSYFRAAQSSRAPAPPSAGLPGAACPQSLQPSALLLPLRFNLFCVRQTLKNLTSEFSWAGGCMCVLCVSVFLSDVRGLEKAENKTALSQQVNWAFSFCKFPPRPQVHPF